MKEESFIKTMKTLFYNSYFGQGIEPEEIVLSANLTNDLGLDSLDQVEFLMVLEKEFNIRIDDDEFEACATLGDVFVCLKNHGVE